IGQRSSGSSSRRSGYKSTVIVPAEGTPRDHARHPVPSCGQANQPWYPIRTLLSSVEASTLPAAAEALRENARTNTTQMQLSLFMVSSHIFQPQPTEEIVPAGVIDSVDGHFRKRKRGRQLKHILLEHNRMATRLPLAIPQPLFRVCMS